MERYTAARPDIFFIGADGSMRSNRAFSQAAGHYACDLFIGSTLQIDLQGNSSTATKGRIAGFGGAPNMGADARGRRHASPAWLRAGREGRGNIAMPRGQKLVVQIVETFREHMQPTFVERLDAWELAETANMELPPVMIYGEDLTHIITEEGIANLLLCRTPRSANRRSAAWRVTPRSAWRATGAWWKTCATAASSAARKISASERATPRATCSPRAASRIWCMPPVACTSRPGNSATGNRITDTWNNSP